MSGVPTSTARDHLLLLGLDKEVLIEDRSAFSPVQFGSVRPRQGDAVFGVVAGLLYANAVEWVVHRYVLHGLGKRKGNLWSFHWHEHHRNSRRFDMYDPGYQTSFLSSNGHGKEVAGIALLMAVHAPLWFVSRSFATAVVLSGVNYLHRHKKSHLDPEWAKKHMRSHYDHHMGKNQDANWCVSYPWLDWLMGTRVVHPLPGESVG